MKEKNILEIDLNKTLVDVIKLDRNLQESIKNKVTQSIIEDITERFLDEYYEQRWTRDEKELKQTVVDEISESREEFLKKILKDFAEKMRGFSSDNRKKAYEEFKKSVEELYK